MLFLISILAAAWVPAVGAQEGRIAVVPTGAPFFTPDTGLGLGIYVVTCIEPEDLSPRPDEITFFGTLTQKMQASAGIMPEIYFQDGDFKISGYLEVNRYPGSFWGIGPETEDGSEETYDPMEFSLKISFLRRSIADFYFGPRFAYRWSDISIQGPGLSGTAGGKGSRDVGVGFEAILDRRDDPFFPRSGILAGLVAEWYRRELGGEYNFSVLEADLRGFIDTGPFVLALQGNLRTAGGQVPFRALSSLGGSSIMRGLRSGRYLDKVSAAVQGELRFLPAGRFGAVVFLSAGEVRPSLNRLSGRDLKIAGGAGLRFLLDRKRNIAARLDLGFTSDGIPGVYLLVKEAF